MIFIKKNYFLIFILFCFYFFPLNSLQHISFSYKLYNNNYNKQYNNRFNNNNNKLFKLKVSNYNLLFKENKNEDHSNILTTLISNTPIYDNNNNHYGSILLLDHEGKLNYKEGQSIGILPQDQNFYNNNLINIQNKINYYSIGTSPLYGENNNKNLIKLYIKNKEFSSNNKSSISFNNLLCNLKNGTKIKLKGPYGNKLLLPNNINNEINDNLNINKYNNDVNKSSNYLFLTTGNGITPIRSILHTLLLNPQEKFKNKIHLISGFKSISLFPFYEEFNQIVNNNPNEFYMDVIYSKSFPNNEEENSGYITKIINNYTKNYLINNNKNSPFSLFFNSPLDFLLQDSYIYICGLMNMLPGVLTALENHVKYFGLSWADYHKTLIENNRLKIEVF